LVQRTVARDWKEWRRAVLEAEAHNGMWQLWEEGKEK